MPDNENAVLALYISFLCTFEQCFLYLSDNMELYCVAAVGIFISTSNSLNSSFKVLKRG